jgi:endonuclease/exonuclease/phosphatase (EEP) superfamily protein YafD
VLWNRSVWRGTHARGMSLDVSPYGAGCAAVVVLHHRSSGLVVPVVDVHMLPGVDGGGHPRNRPARVAAYGRAMHRLDGLLAKLRAHRGRVIVGGDWNVDYYADRRVQARPFPYAHLHRELDTHWAKLPTTRATHRGGRRIDAVWWSERDELAPVDSDTIGGTFSDHSFVRLTLAARRG